VTYQDGADGTAVLRRFLLPGREKTYSLIVLEEERIRVRTVR
jgi:hypothetical protein